MHRNIARVLVVATASLLVACQDTPSSTGPRVTDAALSQDPSTSGRRLFTQIDRLGNPLVSEVTIVKARHGLHNAGMPSTDVANFNGDVSGFITGVAGRDAAYAQVIAGALLPDMLLIYPKRDGTPVFWLSWVFGHYGGRALNDDVVDTGLGAIFGSLLGNTNNVSPGLTTDNVPANDVPFRSTFPYLAAAH